MSVTFSTQNQALLRHVALSATLSTGFADDARFVLVSSEKKKPLAIGVWQFFEDGMAEFHFGALDRGWARRDLLRGFDVFAAKMLRLHGYYAPINAGNTRSLVAALKNGFVIADIEKGGAKDGGNVIVLVKTLRPSAPAPATSIDVDEPETEEA